MGGVPRFAENKRELSERFPHIVTAPAVARFEIPFLTTGLLLLLLLIFAAELGLSANGVQPGVGPSVPTLISFGALDRQLAVHDHEWWRIATAPFLHANLAHIIGNGVVLLGVGWMLERLVGRAWLALTYALSALGGSVAALLIDPPDLPAVGASGAIMGLLAAAFVVSFHVEALGRARRLRVYAAFFAIPALIPTDPAPGATMLTGYSAHFGGAAAGALIGFVIMALWPENADRPRYAGAVGRAATAMFLGAAVSFAAVGLHYQAYATRAQFLISDEDMPKTIAAGAARSAELVAAYPHDPRARVFRAAYFESFQDWRDAEAQIRAALDDPQTSSMGISSDFRLDLHYQLAMLLGEQGRLDEAADAALPVCKAPPSATLADIQSTLNEDGLCPAPEPTSSQLPL